MAGLARNSNKDEAYTIHTGSVSMMTLLGLVILSQNRWRGVVGRVCFPWLCLSTYAYMFQHLAYSWPFPLVVHPVIFAPWRPPTLLLGHRVAFSHHRLPASPRMRSNSLTTIPYDELLPVDAPTGLRSFRYNCAVKSHPLNFIY